MWSGDVAGRRPREPPSIWSRFGRSDATVGRRPGDETCMSAVFLSSTSAAAAD